MGFVEYAAGNVQQVEEALADQFLRGETNQAVRVAFAFTVVPFGLRERYPKGAFS